MRGNRSRLHSCGAIGITTALLCGGFAAAATAATVVPTVAPNAAGASLPAVGAGSASTGELAQGVGAGATGLGGRLGDRPAAADAQMIARQSGTHDADRSQSVFKGVAHHDGRRA